jgi:hypothetical protein
MLTITNKSKHLILIHFYDINLYFAIKTKAAVRLKRFASALSG